ncbi:MAG TPA: hypothetical protein VHM90_15980 [Phycisphaerae bacterium]|jgi:hypothetical protein|nr:hypothetical protein [Phycisphaerae bacterium]
MRTIQSALGVAAVAIGSLAFLPACESEPRGALYNWNYYPGRDQSDRSTPDYDTYLESHNSAPVKTGSEVKTEEPGTSVDSETMKESDALKEDPTSNAGFYDATRAR